MTVEAPERKQRGRPQGSANIESVVTVAASRCAACGSTERAPYSNTRELDHGGTTTDGQDFTHVVWRSTRCLKCGQARVDKTFENRK